MGSVVITQSVMTSALGLDKKTSCSAARAGLVRSNESETYKFGVPTKGAAESAIVHQLPLITKGFQDRGRLGIILRRTMNDLVEQLPLKSITGPIYLYLSLPHPHRTYRGAFLSASEPAAAVLELEQAIDKDTVGQEVYAGMIQQAVDNLPWPTPPMVRKVVYSGSCGVTECISAALDDLLQTQQHTLAVVIGVDSLVSEKELKWLHATHRLKSAANSTGVQPGEGSAAFVLCRSDTARKFGLTTIGTIDACETIRDDNPLIKGKQSDGQALARIMGLLISKQEPPEHSLWVVSDHNGEWYRANELGMSINRLKAKYEHLEIGTTWFPAISFGYVEAAYGAMAIGMVAEAFSGHYAPSPCAYVLSSSDGETRCGLLISNNRQD